MTKEELHKELEYLLSEVSKPFQVSSPLFFQHSYDFPNLVSRAGKLWSKCKTYYEQTRLKFEIWEAATEISVRQYLESLNDASTSIKGKPDRVTEAKIQAHLKTDAEYATMKGEVIEAEELMNLAEKGVFEAMKLRGFISQAIVRKKED